MPSTYHQHFKLPEAMHNSLLISEILRIIFTNLDDQEDLLKCALVCKAWSDLALSLAWAGGHVFLEDVLAILGPISVIQSDMFMPQAPELLVVGFRAKDISPEKWSRFYKYASYITSLELITYRAISFSRHVVDELLALAHRFTAFGSPCIFPNLQNISFKDRAFSEAWVSTYPLFLSPSTIKFAITLPASMPASLFFQSLSIIQNNITVLDLASFVLYRDLSEGTIQDEDAPIPPSKDIHTLSLRYIPFNWGFLRAVSISFENLRSLKFTLNHLTSVAISRDIIFPTLERLDIDREDSEQTIDPVMFLRYMQFPQLKHFSVCFDISSPDHTTIWIIGLERVCGATLQSIHLNIVHDLNYHNHISHIACGFPALSVLDIKTDDMAAIKLDITDLEIKDFVKRKPKLKSLILEGTPTSLSPFCLALLAEFGKELTDFVWLPITLEHFSSINPAVFERHRLPETLRSLRLMVYGIRPEHLGGFADALSSLCGPTTTIDLPFLTQATEHVFHRPFADPEGLRAMIASSIWSMMILKQESRREIAGLRERVGILERERNADES